MCQFRVTNPIYLYEKHKIFIYTGFLKAQKEEIRGQTNRRGKGGKERMKAAKRGRRGKEAGRSRVGGERKCSSRFFKCHPTRGAGEAQPTQNLVCNTLALLSFFFFFIVQ